MEITAEGLRALVFPARAGMILTPSAWGPALLGIPRESGDDPFVTMVVLVS